MPVDTCFLTWTVSNHHLLFSVRAWIQRLPEGQAHNGQGTVQGIASGDQADNAQIVVCPQRKPEPHAGNRRDTEEWQALLSTGSYSWRENATDTELPRRIGP